MDPSVKLWKTQIPEIRGRARSRPANEKGKWRSNSEDDAENSDCHRMFMDMISLGYTSSELGKLYRRRRTRSQTRYQDVSSVIHLDKTRFLNVDAGEQHAPTPGLMWRWRMPNISNLYQYKPLERITDFRLLHILPAIDNEEIIHCGFTRHNTRADKREFWPFVFVEDTPAFYESRRALIMVNGLPLFVAHGLEAMLKSTRRRDTTVLLFNRSVCIGEQYRVYEAISTRWDAEELETEVRQLCTRRRLRDLNLMLGPVLLWSEALGLTLKGHAPYDIYSFDAVEPSVESKVELGTPEQTWDCLEKPAVGARLGSYLRGRWHRWTGEDGTRPWARQLHCRTRSADSGPSPIEPFKCHPSLPPSESPSRRSRSEQRSYQALGWRAQEVDMDGSWDGLFYTYRSGDSFLWNCAPRPLPSDIPFKHSNIDYDKEIVLARFVDDDDSRTTALRFGLMRFRWDRVPQFIFIANSMTFDPYAQAVIQINGQFSRISRSLEVCLRSLQEKNLSAFIFAWPLCIPLHRMIDTSWLEAMFCTIFSKAASTLDGQAHLTSLSSPEIERYVRASRTTSKVYDRHVDAWTASKRERPRALIEAADERDSGSSDGSPSPREEAFNDCSRSRSESIPDHANEEECLDLGTVSLPPPFHWQQSIWNEYRDIPTVAFRDYDLASKTGQLAHVRNAFGGIYCPLNPVSGDVRLVAVLPEDSKAPSRLDVLIESREINWGYIAISYCWGNADDQVEISVNGNAVSVRRNLYDFLMYWREAPLVVKGRGPDAGRFTLWIDALSINQRDKREKAREVRRMNRIYEEADFVLVWLGTAAAKLPYDVAALLEDAQAKESELQQVAEVLVGNPYFFRAWCTQELVVHGDVNVCIGKVWLPWMKLVELVRAAFMAAALQSIGKDSSDEGRHMECLFHSGSAMTRFEIISWLRYRQHCKAPPTLLSLLAATSHCDCSVAADQLYSLYGLASDASTLLSDIDYLKPAKDVFRDFAKSWMLKYKRCDILAFAESPDINCTFDSMGLQGANPSWVPDWTLRRPSWPLLATWTLPIMEVEVDLEADDIESQWLYNACGRTPANIKFLNIWGGPGLFAAGIRADRLLEVLDTFSGFPDISRWHEVCLSWLRDIRKHAKPPEDKDAEWSRVYDLLDALVAGRFYEGTKRTGDDCPSYLALGEPGDHIIVVNEVDGRVDLRRFETHDNAWVIHCMRVFTGRRLAITETGHVGLVPASAAVGDEVVVIFGCSMPLLFRQDEGSHARRTIGECYFHRMMDGQVVNAAGDIEVPDFETPSNLSNIEASTSVGGSLESMRSLSDLLKGPSSDDGPRAQWFCIV